MSQSIYSSILIIKIDKLNYTAMNDLTKSKLADNGLIQLCSKFQIIMRIPPFIITPSLLFSSFQSLKHNFLEGNYIILRYNIIRLIKWVVEDIQKLQSGLFDSQPELQINVLVYFMNLMQFNQAERIFSSLRLIETDINTNISFNSKDRFNESSNSIESISWLQTYLAKIIQQSRQTIKRTSITPSFLNNPLVKMIFRKIQITVEKFIKRTQQFLKNPKELIYPLQQMDLQHIWSLLLVNFRKLIREKFHPNDSLLNSYKLLQIKLYYLSAVNIKKSQQFIHRISQDPSSLQRNFTFSYLLYSIGGLQSLYYYFKQAPLHVIQSEMNYLSILINSKPSESLSVSIVTS